MSRGTGASDPDRPLAGRRVLVTRGVGQSAGLAERLRARGAEVIEVPTVRIAGPDDPRPFHDALRSIAAGDWLLLTSVNAVQAVADAAGTGLPGTVRLASAGPATTEAIRSLLPGGAVAAEATNAFGASGLALALAAFDVAGSRMLLPVSDRSPAALADTLRALGARVDVVVAYRTTIPEGVGERLRVALEAGLDAVAFASPSAIEAFALLGEPGHAVPAVAIGPSTASAARAAGFAIVVTAEAATAEGLAAAVERHLSGTPGKR